MNEINPVFRKTSKLGKRALIVFILIFGIAYLKGTIEFISGSYIKEKRELIKLDTISLLSQAYVISGGRHGGKRINFEDANRYQFSIDNFVYNSIVDIDFILDTLSYNGTKIIVYTDKEGYEKYVKKLKSKKIDVYQLEISEKQYISLENVNSLRKNELIFRVSLFTLVFVGLGVGYWRMRQKASSN